MTSPNYPTRFVRADEARARYGGRVDRLGEALWRGDPLADAVILDLEAGEIPGGWRAVEAALAGSIAAAPGAPASLRALCAQAEAAPLWADMAQINRGGELLYRGGAFSGLVLGFKSLIYGYCAPGGNKPLVFSGRLAEQAPRRLHETTAFVHRVCLTGGLERHAPGYCAALQVRLMHARVRHLLRRDPRWRAQDWGEPINQHDTMATLFLFSSLLLRGLRALGYQIDPDEAARYMLLWRYVGHLMGVEEPLLPVSEAQAMDAAAMIEATQEPPDEDARRLTAALFGSGIHGARTPQERAQAQRLLPFYQGLSRALLGDALADHLALPDTAWKRALPALRAVVARAEALRQLTPALRQRQIDAGHRHWEQVLSLGARGGPAVTFAPPQHLAAAAAF